MTTRAAISLGCLLAVSASAGAVKPGTWTHATEADFAACKLDKAVTTSLGELTLARALETLMAPREKLGMVSAVAVDPKGRVFVAVAPGARIFRLEKGKPVEFAKVPGVLIRYLAFARGRLLAGVSGASAGLYRIDGEGKVTPIWKDKQVKGVWDVVPGPGGSYYVATGPAGKIYHVRPGGKAEVVYDSDEKNILSLAPGPDGSLYAGTGENGLIVLVDPAGKSGRVLYDAAEKEISRLVVDADGVLYAATSDTTKASADGSAPAKESKGRPDKPKAAVKKPAAAKPKGPPKKPVPAAGPEAAPKKNVSGARSKLAAGPGGRPPTSAPAGVAATPTPRPPRPAQVTRPSMIPPTSRRPSRPGRPSGTPGVGKGNAVYRIDADGFVQPVFRRPVTILDMILRGRTLLLATGHGGQLFAVEPSEDRIAILTKVDPKDVTALAVDGKGTVYLATADKAGVFALRDGHAASGTCISKAFDARQIARWGTFRVRADVPAGCKVTLATRSGNVAKPDDKTWSTWSAEMPVETGWRRIGSPTGRFLQYRLTLTGKGAAAPVVERVQLMYQVSNLAPVVSAVKVAASASARTGRGGSSGGGGGPMRYRMIQVKGTDPNGDALKTSVYFRRAGRTKWIKLAEKLAKPTYAWDTRAVPDGTYEIKVEMTDAPANPPATALTGARIAVVVVVDNTPPRVADLLARPDGKGKIKLSGRIADATSRIKTISYAVDTNDEWVAVLPADGICDSPAETFSATISDLDAGAHRVAVRAADELGNVGYASVEVVVGK